MGEFEGLGRNQFEEGDYYINELGYRVFTEQYLLKRSYCCRNNCKQCPYEFKTTDEKDNCG